MPACDPKRTLVESALINQYPAPQRYCQATPKVLNSLPVRVEMPVLALSLMEL
jgi:hypothetical protein